MNKSYVSAQESNLKLIVKVAFGIIFQVPLLFIPAGTFEWPEAWLFLFLFTCYALGATFYLKKHNPELLGRRTSYKLPEKGWDKLFLLSTTILFVVTYIIMPLDAVRYKWSSVPLSFKATGFIGVTLSLIAIFWVLKENAYLFRTVTVQEGQKVVTTGPYKYLRHPMYASFILMSVCIPLALGSYYALIPSFVINLLLITRTYLEDKELHRELPGYNEYAKKTKYKLIPGVW